MKINIIADSSCEIDGKLKNETGGNIVPLNLLLGDKQYIDDDTLDINTFLQDMKNSPVAPKSASPSPQDFLNRFNDAENTFIVTLSSKISGTYNSAIIAKDMFLEINSSKFVHVFDSLSASIAETLIVLKIHELAKKNLKNYEIVNKVSSYIKEMKTFFLLESLDHLIKSGRINRLSGALASLLSIKPIMGNTKEGTIDLVEKVRGSKKSFSRLVDLIGEKGTKLEDKILGIAHCNALEKAESFKAEVLKKYNFKDVIILEMGPTISAYADEDGLLIAF